MDRKLILIETNSPLHLDPENFTGDSTYIEGALYWVKYRGNRRFEIDGLQNHPNDFLPNIETYTELCSIYDVEGIMYWELFWNNEEYTPYYE